MFKNSIEYYEYDPPLNLEPNPNIQMLSDEERQEQLEQLRQDLQMMAKKIIEDNNSGRFSCLKIGDMQNNTIDYKYKFQ